MALIWGRDDKGRSGVERERDDRDREGGRRGTEGYI